MKLKDLLSPFILIAAGLAFLLISALVFLNKGKSKRLIASKLKIGAFLLTFSWFVGGCSSIGSRNASCYLQPASNSSGSEPEYIAIYSYKSNPYNNITAIAGDSIIVTVNYPKHKYYSYEIIDSITNKLKQKGELSLFYTNYDNYKDFTIKLDLNLSQGTYKIKYFGYTHTSYFSHKDQIEEESTLYIK